MSPESKINITIADKERYSNCTAEVCEDCPNVPKCRAVVEHNHPTNPDAITTAQQEIQKKAYGFDDVGLESPRQ
jgi:hypothetical protein